MGNCCKSEDEEQVSDAIKPLLDEEKKKKDALED
jgi:hypothetical protein